MIVCYCVSTIFFFSSRRRHTRSLCDWSSDVCSSDLSFKLNDSVTSFNLMADAFDESGALGEGATTIASRSEEHTSELQSHSDLVCRLLLEKKKKKKINSSTTHREANRKHTNRSETIE